jgi:hypothetical protein
MDIPVQPDIPAQPDQINPEAALIQEVSWPLYRTRNWLKFIGVFYIIIGALYILLALIGLFVSYSNSSYRNPSASFSLILGVVLLAGFCAVLIWMGVVLFRAGSRVNNARVYGQKAAMIETLGNLRTFFVILGVMVIVSLGVAALYICFGIALVGAMG